MGDTTFEATLVGKSLLNDAILADYETRIATLEAGGMEGGMSEEQLEDLNETLAGMAARLQAPSGTYIVSDEAGADYASLTAAIAAHPGPGVQFLLRGTVTEPAPTGADTMFADGQHYEFEAGCIWDVAPAGSNQEFLRRISASDFTIKADGPITIPIENLGSNVKAIFAIDDDCEYWTWQCEEVRFAFNAATLAGESGLVLLGRTSTDHTLSHANLGTINAMGTVAAIASGLTIVDCGLRYSAVGLRDNLVNSGTSRTFTRFSGGAAGTGAGNTITYTALATSGWTHVAVANDLTNHHMGTAASGVSLAGINAGSGNYVTPGV